jgi:hypothetical protein
LVVEFQVAEVVEVAAEVVDLVEMLVVEVVDLVGMLVGEVEE